MEAKMATETQEITYDYLIKLLEELFPCINPDSEMVDDTVIIGWTTKDTFRKVAPVFCLEFAYAVSGDSRLSTGTIVHLVEYLVMLGLLSEGRYVIKLEE